MIEFTIEEKPKTKNILMVEKYKLAELNFINDLSEKQLRYFNTKKSRNVSLNNISALLSFLTDAVFRFLNCFFLYYITYTSNYKHKK